MKKILFASFLLIMFTACNPAKQETSRTDSTAVKEDTMVTADPAEKSGPAPALTPQSFEEIPADLQAFLDAVQDRETLADYINTEVGCYILDEGPGVYPVVKEVTTKEDFSKSKQFLLFMNTPKLYNGYYINSENGNPCNLPAEGIYFSTVKKNNNLLFNAYQSHLFAFGEDVPVEMKEKLDELDAALAWNGTINLPDKSGELNTFEIYLAIIDDKVYLAAIDTRGCGI